MIGPALLAVTPMAEKLGLIIPEMILFAATVAALVLGSSARRATRGLCAPVAFVALVAAGVLAVLGPSMPHSPVPGLMTFGKGLVAAVGALLVLLIAGTIDRDLDADAVERGAIDAARANAGEFYAFLLFSLTGLMLCCSADDLIWLFLALELTSLPTYVMVSISTPRARSQEAGVKYFFLGAFGAAIFLYGFALLYGACGTTLLFGAIGEPTITASLAEQAAAGGLSPIAVVGLVMAVVGVCFKIAAVPMHFYTPDVYQGAATTVAAFLAFVPKMAGFVALMLLVSAVGWSFGEAGDALPEPLRVTLWVIAALTMTVGNVLALLQSSVKRILAYSSIAHSGYMLVGLIAGPGDGDPAHNGLAALLFYMLCYGFMNLGAFAVLACLERRADRRGVDDIENVADLRGLCYVHPLLGWTMVLSAASLLGLPPLLGFFGKFYLFTSAIAAGEIALVVVLGVNSAIAAFYYLRLVAAPLLEDPDDQTRSFTLTAFPTRLLAAVASAAAVVVLVPFASPLMRASDAAARPATDDAALTAPTPELADETNRRPTITDEEAPLYAPVARR
jgi:NADH-quinone oxidoreductase subunit N